jgi:hypothetical protein
VIIEEANTLILVRLVAKAVVVVVLDKLLVVEVRAI